MKVFISYAREDEPAARRLYRSLSGIPGVLPWLDREQLLPGDDWRDAIARAVEDSRLIVVVLSSHSVSKDGYVQKEVRDALQLLDEKSPGKCFLIPARIEFCVPHFRQLHKLQWADLFEDWDHGVARIRAAIEREQARDRELERAVDAIQQKKNRDDARQIIEGISDDLKANLAKYAEWLWRHDYLLHPYNEARQRIPKWTGQAKPEWLAHLKSCGALDSTDPVSACFTDIGLEILDLI